MSDNKILLENKTNGLFVKNGVSFLLPFIMITSCFALWGFANDVTGPMVKAFSKIFRMSVTEGAMVQVAFYLGYFVMAFPPHCSSSVTRSSLACSSALAFTPSVHCCSFRQRPSVCISLS